MPLFYLFFFFLEKSYGFMGTKPQKEKKEIPFLVQLFFTYIFALILYICVFFVLDLQIFLYESGEREEMAAPVQRRKGSSSRRKGNLFVYFSNLCAFHSFDFTSFPEISGVIFFNLGFYIYFVEKNIILVVELSSSGILEIKFGVPLLKYPDISNGVFSIWGFLNGF